jgi:hypothetical protein
MKAPLLAIALAILLAGCASPAGESLARGRIVPGATLAPQDPGWSPIEQAKIRPGVMVHTEARDCPTNFVFVRPDNTSVFIGTSAYCVREMHVGSVASVGTNDTIGVLIYSSFITMDEIGEPDTDARQFNDFAVFRIDDQDRKWVHPAMLPVGGPVGPAAFSSLGVGARVRTFVNLDDGAPDASHVREGIIGATAGNWAYLVYGAPAIPGQMGAGVVTPEGGAVGVMVSLGVSPNPGANGVARLDTLLSYAKENAKLDMTLVGWDLLATALGGSTASSQS